MLVQLYRISLEDSLEAVRHSAEVRNDVKLQESKSGGFVFCDGPNFVLKNPH